MTRLRRKALRDDMTLDQLLISTRTIEMPEKKTNLTHENSRNKKSAETQCIKNIYETEIEGIVGENIHTKKNFKRKESLQKVESL